MRFITLLPSPTLESRSDVLSTRLTLTILEFYGSLSVFERLRFACIRLLHPRCTGAEEGLLKRVSLRLDLPMQLPSLLPTKAVGSIEKRMGSEFPAGFSSTTSLH